MSCEAHSASSLAHLANARKHLGPGGQMKFHTLVSAVAGIAVCTTTAAAQLCQGDLSFRGSPKHVGAALGMSSNSTSFGGGLTVGHTKGWYGGGSLGMASYSNVTAHSIALGGGIGYS